MGTVTELVEQLLPTSGVRGSSTVQCDPVLRNLPLRKNFKSEEKNVSQNFEPVLANVFAIGVISMLSTAKIEQPLRPSGHNSPL